MNYRDEVRTGASVGGWWIFIVILMFATAGGSWWLFQRPHIDRGYSQQVNGLVTAWCTAPGDLERENARGDIIGEKNSAPQRWARMTDASRNRADRAIQKDRSVCE